MDISTAFHSTTVRRHWLRKWTSISMNQKDQAQADVKTMASGTYSHIEVEDSSTKHHNTHKEGLFERITDHFKHSSDGSKPKKHSISDSGPYIFAIDPNTGKEVLQKNPHWPNEDSWKRVEATKGQWGFGSMAGQQNVDFGGTTG